MPKISSITLPDNNTYEFNAYGLTPSHTLTGEAGWYKVLTLNVTSGTTRSLEMLISHSYSPTAGILRIYLNKISTGQTSSSRVNWLTTTIPVEYVRWEIETVNDTSTMSIYFYKSTSNSGIVDFFLIDYKNHPATTRDLPSGNWYSEAVSRPETANVATADILNNAATADSATTAGSATTADTATNALNDGNGDQIDTTYLKTTDTTKAPAKAGVYYGICNSLESDITKTVTINEITSLYDGLQINVLFANSTISSPQLSLQLNNFIGASIRTSNDGSYAASGEWKAGEVVLLTYNQFSNFWIIRSHASASYYGVTKLNSAINSSSSSTAATPFAVKTAYDLAASKSKLIRFTAQAVSAASNAEIFRITDSDITMDTEVVSVEFADPSYITAGGSWTSYAGYVAFTGTCTAATTADVILKI